MPDIGEEDRVIASRPTFAEHVDGDGIDSVVGLACSDVVLRNRTHRRKFHNRAAKVGVLLCGGDHETARSSPYVQHTADTTEVVISCEADRGRQRMRMHSFGNVPRLLDRHVAGGPSIGNAALSHQVRRALRARREIRSFLLQPLDERVSMPFTYANAHHWSPVEGAGRYKIDARLVR